MDHLGYIHIYICTCTYIHIDIHIHVHVHVYAHIQDPAILCLSIMTLSNHSAALCFNLGPRMLDILLLTILTEKDEVERTSALVFLEEHGKSLVWDEE